MRHRIREKNDLFQQIKEIIYNNCTARHSLIMLGDFNAVMNNNLDIITGEKHNPRETDSFRELINSLELIDSWRTINQEERQYTWSRNHPFIARRLDYIFVTESLIENIQQSQIISVPLTDHRAVETNIS